VNAVHRHQSIRDRRDLHDRLAIGVTGHRNIAVNNARLRATVLRELLQLQRSAPGRRAVVLSCLAEGADRLVARIAIDQLKAELVAILPMPLRDYRRDFHDVASRREFDALLGAATRRVTVADEGVRAEAARDGERARRYARAGAWLVQRSDVLLAIWDGKPERGIGGTAQIVRWMLSGSIPRRYVWRAPGDEPAPPRAPGRVVHVDPATCQVAYLGGASD
jgi:hypothetical protein